MIDEWTTRLRYFQVFQKLIITRGKRRDEIIFGIFKGKRIQKVINHSKREKMVDDLRIDKDQFEYSTFDI